MVGVIRRRALTDVGDVGLDCVPVVFADRESPDTFARCFPGFERELAEFVAILKDAGSASIDRPNDGAGQRRIVDHEIGI